jgi:response regulator RpfG family c-di-GMP phosphodiesterase
MFFSPNKRMKSTFLSNFTPENRFYPPIRIMLEKNINVLYVDDEPNNINSFKAAFRRVFNIYTAESAEEGRKIIEQETIHVIFSDQRMPKTTGIEFFQSILDSHPEPIRILITGYTDINAVIDAINVGQVYKYLSKPWNEEDVRNCIVKAYEVFDLRQKNKELTERLVEVNKKLEFLARQGLLS